MRKLISLMHVSLDGYCGGPKGEMDWIAMNDAIFADAGFVNESSWNFDGASYNADYGFGLRLDLPIGPIRIDYGIPFVSDGNNGSSGKVQFNIGYQF